MSSPQQDYIVPEEYLYTKDHEWVKVNKDGSIYIGITDYAAKMLHDIVYVVLPSEGTSFKSGEVFGQVESVKTVSDIYMPVSCIVVKTNQALTKTPEIVSNSPYSDGWMIEISPSDYENESKNLLDSNTYRKHIEELKRTET